MAATKWVYVVLLMLLLSWWGSVCFANRDINDKNQKLDRQEAIDGGVGASWSWGNNAGFGVVQGGGTDGVGFNIGGSFGDGVGSGSGVGFGTGSGYGHGSGVGSGYGSGIGSGTGTSGGLGCGSKTGSASGQDSGTGSGKGCGTGGKGSGTGSGSGSGSDQGSGGCGSGCTGSGQASGIPSFQIPGLPPIPLWGLHCAPIECPAGDCGGIRMFFDYSSQHTANLHANQETKTHDANQGINTHDHNQNLNDKINGVSVVTPELKRSTHGSINSNEAKNYFYDPTSIASVPKP